MATAGLCNEVVCIQVWLKGIVICEASQDNSTISGGKSKCQSSGEGCAMNSGEYGLQ